MRIALPTWKPVAAVAAAGALSLALLAPVGAQTNQAPTPQNDVATTAEDTPVTIAVVANDTDPDGNTLTLTSVGVASNGSVAISGNSVIYTPKANFHGTDAFNYAVTDGGILASAQVTVTVTPVNDAPVAEDDSVTVKENQAKAISVLSNDKDVDGDTLTVQATSAPAHGTAVIGADGKVTYTPTTDYVGTDSFTYVVSDGTLNDIGTVTITVKEATTPISDRDSKVVEACAAHAGQPGISTLCGLYLERTDLPWWARKVIGKNILKIAARSSASDRVLEVCAAAPAGSAITQLCSLYQNESMPSWLRSQVGKLVLKIDSFEDRADVRDRDDDDRKKDRDDDRKKENKKDRDDDRRDNGRRASLNVSFGDDDRDGDDRDEDRKRHWFDADRDRGDDDDDDDRRGRGRFERGSDHDHDRGRDDDRGDRGRDKGKHRGRR